MRERELTARAVVWGLVLGFLLAAANVYAGLKIAYVDAGSTTIVLLSFAVFGAGARRFTAREANVAQVVGTSASTMAVTAGLIGPVPALAMSGHEIAPLAILLWGGALAVLGTLVALPFRATLIEVKQLAFPSARATGELMRNLFVERGAGRHGIRLLAVTAAIAALVTIARDGLHLIDSAWTVPVAVFGVPAAALSLGLAPMPLVVGVGVLAGARVGVGMVVGGVIAWIAIAPQLVATAIAAPSYGSLVTWLLWPGAALMIASSLVTLALDGRVLIRGIRGSRIAAGRWVAVAAGGAAVVAVALGWYGFGVSPVVGALAVVLAAVFSVAAMHATGETDTTPSGPLGGVGQIVVGVAGPGDIVAPLTAGGTVNGVAAHAATMMNAWRAGATIGAEPARLIPAQLAGIAVGAVAAVGAFWLVREAYGLGGATMPVPGAASWKVTAEAVSGGVGAMPAGAPIAALVAAAAGAIATMLQRTRLRAFTPSPIAVGIGFILPLSITLTLALAAVAYAILAARLPAVAAHGPIVGAGLIVGEAFTGVVIAAVIVARALA